MRVLITGITGFVGSHLAEYLLAKGVEVHGIKRWRSKNDNIDHLVGRKRFYLHNGDIRDVSAIHEVLAKVKPQRIFHLAAQSFVPTSWHAPAETLSTNIQGQLNLFEAIRQLKQDPIIQLAGSSEEYGIIYPREIPITEHNPLRPLSPYGVSKVGQDLLGYQYFQSYGLKTIRTRAFNHTGPRRGDVFVLSNFAKQIASIEAGLQPPVLKVGNLSARRDFTDVRDIVRAYWLATEKGKPGEVYNIASDVDYTIRSLLNRMLRQSTTKIDVVQDPDRMRPSDIQRLLGDSSKFRKLTGWKPIIPIEQTLTDILDYWREQLAAGTARTNVKRRVRAAAKSVARSAAKGTKSSKATRKTTSTKAAKPATRKKTSTKAAKPATRKKTSAKATRPATRKKTSAKGTKASTRRSSSTKSTRSARKPVGGGRRKRAR